MPRPRPSRTRLIPAPAGAALLLAVTTASAAQQPSGMPAPMRWSITANIGLISRESGTWDPVHAALAPSGWDTRFPPCTIGCAGAKDIVEGRPIVPGVTVRRRIQGRLQARAFFASGSPGYYPGAYQGQSLAVKPSITTAGIQAAATFGAFWLAAGPLWYHGSVRTTAGAGETTGEQSGAGFAFGAGVAGPRYSRVFVEASIERRLAGSVTMPDIPVAGAPVVPSMTIPMSHWLLSVGAGLRL